MSGESALIVADLKVAFAGARVLRGVSLQVPACGTVGLAGRNGAGKTTTLRAIIGLAPARGAILLDGRPITHLDPAARVRLGIGYAPEDRRLLTALNVEENLRFPGEVCGKSAAEIDARLAMVWALLPELRVLARRPAGFLSGGQQKMAALGRALMIGERLLLLDEPFQGLAPALARRYAEALRAWRRARPNLAILITESNPALLVPLTSRVFRLERGEIVSSDAVPVRRSGSSA